MRWLLRADVIGSHSLCCTWKASGNFACCWRQSIHFTSLNVTCDLPACFINCAVPSMGALWKDHSFFAPGRLKNIFRYGLIIINGKLIPLWYNIRPTNYTKFYTRHTKSLFQCIFHGDLLIAIHVTKPIQTLLSIEKKMLLKYFSQYLKGTEIITKPPHTFYSLLNYIV